MSGHDHLKTPLRIYVTENRSRSGAYTAYVGEDVLTFNSRAPFFAAARVLLRWGRDPATIIEMWWPGTSSFALRARLSTAARLTVAEKPRLAFRLYEHPPHARHD